jgi:hypothetical protein
MADELVELAFTKGQICLLIDALNVLEEQSSSTDEGHRDLCLGLKREVLGPFPMWVDRIEHGELQSSGLVLWCACGHGVEREIHNTDQRAAVEVWPRCPKCQARSVGEAKGDARCPRWSWDLLFLLHDRNRQAGTEAWANCRTSFDKVKRKFEAWYIENRPEKKDASLEYFHLVTGTESTMIPAWYVGAFVEDQVWIVDLTDDRRRPDNRESYRFDPLAGEVLHRMIDEELGRDPIPMKTLCAGPHMFMPIPSRTPGVSYYSRCTQCTATEWEANHPEEFNKRVAEERQTNCTTLSLLTGRHGASERCKVEGCERDDLIGFTPGGRVCQAHRSELAADTTAAVEKPEPAMRHAFITRRGAGPIEPVELPPSDLSEVDDEFHGTRIPSGGAS